MADPVIKKLRHTAEEVDNAVSKIDTVIDNENKIVPNAIPSGAITGPKLGANSVTTGKIAPGTIEARDINQSAFDSTLQEKGKLAEAKVVGDKFKEQGDSINDLALNIDDIDSIFQKEGDSLLVYKTIEGYPNIINGKFTASAATSSNIYDVGGEKKIILQYSFPESWIIYWGYGFSSKEVVIGETFDLGVFAFNDNNGTITINVPSGARYMYIVNRVVKKITNVIHKDFETEDSAREYKRDCGLLYENCNKLLNDVILTNSDAGSGDIINYKFTSKWGTIAVYLEDGSRYLKITKTDTSTDTTIDGEIVLPKGFSRIVVVDGDIAIDYITLTQYAKTLNRLVNTLLHISPDYRINTIIREFCGDVSNVNKIDFYKAFKVASGYVNAIYINDNIILHSDIYRFATEEEALSNIDSYMASDDDKYKVIVDWGKLDNGITRFNNFELRSELKDILFSPTLTSLMNKKKINELESKINDIDSFNFSPTLFARFKGCKIHPASKPFAVDGRYVFAVEENGVRKMDFGIECDVNVVNKKEYSGSRKSHSVVSSAGKVFLTRRLFSSGNFEYIKAKNRIFFEKGFVRGKDSAITSNAELNSMIKGCYFSELDSTAITGIDIYKAREKSAGVYQNYVALRFSNGNILPMLNQTANSQVEALNLLNDDYISYYDMYEDKIAFNWDNVPTGSAKLYTCTFSNVGEFDTYTSNGATITEGEDDYNTPCRYHKKCVLRGNGVARAARNISPSSHIYSNFWMKVSEAPTNAHIPLIGDSGTDLVKLAIKKTGSVARLGVQESGADTFNNELSFNVGEWYNIKVVYANNKVSIYYRTAECGAWEEVVSRSVANTTANEMVIGYESSDGKILIDDYCCDDNDIENLSFVNGELIVYDKNLIEEDVLHLDLKPTVMKIHGNYLYVCMLNGFNIYDISNSAIKLIFSQRGSALELFDRHAVGGKSTRWCEYQDVDFFSSQGKYYAVFTNYTAGVSVWDITNITDVHLVGYGNLDDWGSSVTKSASVYNFNLVVDYPYAYATCAVINQSIGTADDIRGVFVINLRDLSNITTTLVEIPKKDMSTDVTTGDAKPIHIIKIGNVLLTDNAEKGYSVWSVNDGTVEFVSNFLLDSNSIASCLCVDNTGRIFCADSSVGSTKDIYLLRLPTPLKN